MADSLPLISSQQLQQANRLLYMSHLALGDFLYQGVYLQQLHEQYPHLQIDIWFDDCRSRPKAWHTGRNTILSQWLQALPFVGNIYPIVADKQQRQQLIQQANAVQYDVISFIASQRSQNFARIARSIGPDALVVGTKSKPWERPWRKYKDFGALDGWINAKTETSEHISDYYCRLFSSMLAITVDPARKTLPLDIPAEYLQQQSYDLPRVFINHLSTSDKRNYPWPRLVEVIQKLYQHEPQLQFVINVPPDALTSTEQQLQAETTLANIPIQLFTATEHFFELPAMIQQCDMVISVETATMHFASALNKPQLVLMRDTARQWQPLNASKIIWSHSDVGHIGVETIVQAFAQIWRQIPKFGVKF